MTYEIHKWIRGTMARAGRWNTEKKFLRKELAIERFNELKKNGVYRLVNLLSNEVEAISL